MKHLKLTFLLAVLMSMVGAKAYAYDFEVNGIYFSRVSKTTVNVAAKPTQTTGELVTNAKYTGDIVIPSSVNYLDTRYSVVGIEDDVFKNSTELTSIQIGSNVSSIQENAFKGCSNLTKVILYGDNIISKDYTSSSSLKDIFGRQVTTYVIGNNATSIGTYAFYGCENLQSVTIGSGVTTIGTYAFNRCKNLQSVTIGSGVTTIGNSAFESCTGLTSVTIPNNVTTIGEDGFRDCSSLISVTISNSVTNIAEDTFWGCSGLISVNIPNSVTNIGNHAFYGCTGLTSVTIPNSVTNISNRAFSGCSSLTSITIPNSVTNIGFGAFQNCDGLTSVTIPNSVTTIGYSAFYDCDALTSVILPEGLTTIDTDLFWGCNKLSSVNIPSTVTTIRDGAFNSCYALTSITIPRTVTTIGSAVFSSCKGLTSVTFEQGLTVIGDNTFRHCDALTSVTIPGSIKQISDRVFDECLGLTEVTLETGVEIIGRAAFSECPNLTTVNFPSSLIEIGEQAFTICPSLISITIPASVTTIGGGAFNNCPNLVTVTVENPSPVKISSSTFSNRANATLYVPVGSKAAYEVASYWKEFMKIVEPVTDISEIDNVIYMDETEALAGTEATLSIKMKNTAAIRGFQFDMYLPEGVTVAKSTNGKIQGSLSPGRLPSEDEHSLTFSEQADGAIRFLCSSQYDETFTGNDGEIATLKVNVAADMTDGEYPIQMKNIKLTETDISKFYETDLVASHLIIASYVDGDISGDNVVDVSDYTGIANFIHGNPPAGFNEKAADVDKNGTVDVSDYTGIANIIHTGSIYGNSSNSARATGNQLTADWDAKDNVIFIAPFTATAGTKTAISFEMKNTAAIRGFQFDLYLPEGMTVVKSAKGKIQGKLSEGRLPDEDEHDLTFSQQPDGAIRFLCSSQYDETFTGTSGELATLQVEIASDMANGDHAIQLKNMKLTETDISKYYTSDLIESTVTIEGGATTGINSLTSDPSAKGEESGNIYSLDGRKVSNSGLPKGIYIKNGKKVVIK